MKTPTATQTHEPSRCECGALKHPDARKCTVCKALNDHDKKKAKAKAKMKRKVEFPKEVKEHAERVMDSIGKALESVDEDMQADVIRKVLGILCRELTPTATDVRPSFGIHAKEQGTVTIYTMKKLV